MVETQTAGSDVSTRSGAAVAPGVSSSEVTAVIDPSVAEVERRARGSAPTLVTTSEPASAGSDMSAFIPHGVSPESVGRLRGAPGFSTLSLVDQRRFLEAYAVAQRHPGPSVSRAQIETSFMGLLDRDISGTPMLLTRDATGQRSLLDHIHLIATHPGDLLSPGLRQHRSALVLSLVCEAGSSLHAVNQGAYASCCPAVANRYLAGNSPAEYARIIQELATTGSADLVREGERTSMQLEYDPQSAMGGSLRERSISESVFQCSLMNLVGSYENGLDPFQIERMYEAIFSEGYGRIDEPIEILAALEQVTMAGDPNMVSLKWETSGMHANHAVEILAVVSEADVIIQDGREVLVLQFGADSISLEVTEALRTELAQGRVVIGRNPWGGGYDAPEGIGAYAIDKAAATFWMSEATFAERVNFAMVPGGEFGVTAWPGGADGARGFERSLTVFDADIGPFNSSSHDGYVPFSRRSLHAQQEEQRRAAEQEAVRRSVEGTSSAERRPGPHDWQSFFQSDSTPLHLRTDGVDRFVNSARVAERNGIRIGSPEHLVIAEQDSIDGRPAGFSLARRIDVSRGIQAALNSTGSREEKQQRILNYIRETPAEFSAAVEALARDGDHRQYIEDLFEGSFPPEVEEALRLHDIVREDIQQAEEVERVESQALAAQREQDFQAIRLALTSGDVHAYFRAMNPHLYDYSRQPFTAEDFRAFDPLIARTFGGGCTLESQVELSFRGEEESFALAQLSGNPGINAAAYLGISLYDWGTWEQSAADAMGYYQSWRATQEAAPDLRQAWTAWIDFRGSGERSLDARLEGEVSGADKRLLMTILDLPEDQLQMGRFYADAMNLKYPLGARTFSYEINRRLRDMSPDEVRVLDGVLQQTYGTSLTEMSNDRGNSRTETGRLFQRRHSILIEGNAAQNPEFIAIGFRLDVLSRSITPDHQQRVESLSSEDREVVLSEYRRLCGRDLTGDLASDRFSLARRLEEETRLRYYHHR